VKTALTLALLLLPCLARALAPTTETRIWPIDAAQSQAQFSVRKFWIAHVRGTFPGLRGNLRRMDPRSGVEVVQVYATLDAAGLQMGDAGARAQALGPRFFDAERYPVVHFDSDPFPLTELASGGRLRGLLLLHGERHPVTFELLPSGCPRQPIECVIRVRGEISRSDFGMRGWRAVLSDEVELDLRIVLRAVSTLPWPEPAASAGTGVD
jgi:polyisoprenoid-binding protein YceI